ncbi:1-phosphofructokinase family hexose kinase [Microcella alkaliphila]|nr:PfkB family carbohydrate kinase [Microcella alkaliphila]
MSPLAEAHPDRTRVVTLTPAPAVDRVYLLDGLQAGHVNRARHVEAHIAGNGVNLARDLHASGNAVCAVVPLSFEAATDLTSDEQIFRVVPVSHSIRVNTVVIGADGVTTNINQPANSLSRTDWDDLSRAVAAAADHLRADWIVVGGSVPSSRSGEGLDPLVLAEVARAVGARLCLDSPGSVVAEWLGQGVSVDLISPNIHELEEIVGKRIRTMGEAVDSGSALVSQGIGAVLISLGRDGAVVVTPTRQIWAHTSPARVVNTTGAGDAALAGMIALWRGEDDQDAIEAALVRAVRWGRAAVGLITPTISPDDIAPDHVHLGSPPRSMTLLQDLPSLPPR